jgi:protein-serine/threonine kinase
LSVPFWALMKLGQVDKRGLPLPPSNSFSSPAGMLRGLWTRRGSSQVSGPIASGSMSVYESDDLVIVGPSSTSSLNHSSDPVPLPATSQPPTTGAREPIYGDKSNDQFDEVRFSVELTRIDRLEDTLSIDIRRLKGNLRSYKFLYDTLRE